MALCQTILVLTQLCADPGAILVIQGGETIKKDQLLRRWSQNQINVVKNLGEKTRCRCVPNSH